VTDGDRRLDYEPLPAEQSRPSHSGVGIASAVVAYLFLMLAMAARIEVLEALAFQFYLYSTAFITAFALGIWGLILRNRRRAAAWIGVSLSVLGFYWKVTSLYVVMRSCVANGWMTMPWPLR